MKILKKKKELNIRSGRLVGSSLQEKKYAHYNFFFKKKVINYQVRGSNVIPACNISASNPSNKCNQGSGSLVSSSLVERNTPTVNILFYFFFLNLFDLWRALAIKVKAISQISIDNLNHSYDDPCTARVSHELMQLAKNLGRWN